MAENPLDASQTALLERTSFSHPTSWRKVAAISKDSRMSLYQLSRNITFRSIWTCSKYSKTHVRIEENYFVSVHGFSKLVLHYSYKTTISTCEWICCFLHRLRQTLQMNVVILCSYFSWYTRKFANSSRWYRSFFVCDMQITCTLDE